MRNSYVNFHLTRHFNNELIKTQHLIKIIKKIKLKSVRDGGTDQLKKVGRGWRENVTNNKGKKNLILIFFKLF